MATWEDIVFKAKELAGAAGRKVADMAELTKQKIQIAENERNIRDTLEAIGRMVYDGHKSGDVPNEEILAELVQQIDDLYISNEQLQAEIDNYRGRTICTCGASNPQGATYCNACGIQL